MPRPTRRIDPQTVLADPFRGAETAALAALLDGLETDPDEVIHRPVSRDQIAEEKETFAADLHKFIPEAWKWVEPNAFIPNWHIDAIAEHLMAIKDGDIKDLLITMPPRHSKSLIITVIYPVWEWISLPSYRWIFASYAFNLSVRDSMKRRKLIKTRWFQERWGKRVKLLEEQDTKVKYENTRHGFMLASSVGGSNTGEGGERIVADDPHNIKKVESEVIRQDTVDWWNIVMSTRRNDLEKSARIVVQQRTHEGDVAGDIIERGGYVHLNLPTEFGFEGATRCRTSWTEKKTGKLHTWEDPRKEVGELLNPVRFNYEANERAKLELGDYQYACTPAGTPILMSDWTSKPIELVRPGDELVGFDPKGANASGGEAQRQRLFRSKVKRTFSYLAPVQTLVMASGRRIRCTPDHKWWTRRQPTNKEPHRKQYAPAIIGSTIWCVCQTVGECTPRERDLWQYLAGIVDGEGSIKPNILEISQSPTSNGTVFVKIINVLSELGLNFKVYTYPPTNDKWGDKGVIQISNCREVYIKLLRFADPGKRDQILACLYGRKERLAEFGDRVVDIIPGPPETVFALETETGNYIAWGYASSNSQHGQNPTPPKGQIFQAQWMKYYGGPGQPPIPDFIKSNHPVTPLFSLDCTFKESRDTDKIAGLCWAMFGADVYLMPICVHKQASFTNTIDAIAEMVGGENLDKSVKYPGIYPYVKIKLVEDKANGSAIIDTLQHRIPGMVPFSPDGASKESRATACSWRFRAGNVYLPHESIAPWIKEYVYELCAFPRAKRDDFVDATSQALLFIGGDGVTSGIPTMTDQESKWIGFGQGTDYHIESESIWGSINSGGSIWRRN